MVGNNKIQEKGGDRIDEESWLTKKKILIINRENSFKIKGRFIK